MNESGNNALGSFNGRVVLLLARCTCVSQSDFLGLLGFLGDSTCDHLDMLVHGTNAISPNSCCSEQDAFVRLDPLSYKNFLNATLMSGLDADDVPQSSGRSVLGVLVILPRCACGLHCWDEGGAAAQPLQW